MPAPRGAARAAAPLLVPAALDEAAEAQMKQAEATLAQAAAIERLAASAEQAIETFRPAAEAIAHLGEAQRKLCAFLVGNRLKLAASVPVVLVAVGAVSPNAAHLLEAILSAWGVK